jgi:hypothetical protein
VAPTGPRWASIGRLEFRLLDRRSVRLRQAVWQLFPYVVRHQGAPTRRGFATALDLAARGPTRVCGAGRRLYRFRSAKSILGVAQAPQREGLPGYSEGVAATGRFRSLGRGSKPSRTRRAGRTAPTRLTVGGAALERPA